ncbi:hypothetical protein GYMLUDRAFT_248984 [Collybiopsis luxurians FD-317 M1]|uniref:Unplaced genomic scaffold GYMLUscaffold_62, whole genome shotgun sequence n=1 Tax=Collybiopsis luxurians FD-317 M1 TaxID=944289 RepID=A0A0D0CAC6_9AGAR|nr:hypothetical protein GYMLUDRAFT_248984 [Collybiopsis luxurians FD-317 M1]
MSSWVKTDTGFDEDTSPSVLVSDDCEAHLCTKFLWHYVPTYVMVLGTVYEQEFIKLAITIYIAHWPEDTTYGLKSSSNRTCFKKQISFLDGGNSSEWKLKALPAWYDRWSTTLSVENLSLWSHTAMGHSQSVTPLFQSPYLGKILLP